MKTQINTSLLSPFFQKGVSRFARGGGIIGILILIDAITKLWSESLENTLLLVPNLLSFQYAQNTGIAFSMPLSGIALKIITVILIFVIIWYYIYEEKSKSSKLVDLGYIFIISGALGNAWERIFRGYVTDFIALEYFAIFNLADTYISIGGAIILLYYFRLASPFSGKEKELRKKL